MLRLPQNIGPLRYAGENRYSDRRIGRSFGYNASGISLNIFVYDYGIRNLPEGPDSVAACEQFESAKQEIERGGNYQNVVLRGEVTRPLRAGAAAPLAREAVYEFERNGLKAISVLWITADGRLLHQAAPVDAHGDRRRARRGARGRFLNRSRIRSTRDRRARRPRRPGRRPEASIEMAAGGDAADAAMWLAYAVEISKFARENPGVGPPCGGLLDAVVRARARGAARGACANIARGPRTGAARTISTCCRGSTTAGFLDEYVWSFLHRNAWGVSPPHELTIGRIRGISRARARITHVVQSGAHVRIHAVRVLPLAP